MAPANPASILAESWWDTRRPADQPGRSRRLDDPEPAGCRAFVFHDRLIATVPGRGYRLDAAAAAFEGRSG